MLKHLNRVALFAANDNQIRELLIKDQEKTILCTASSACRRYVTKSDDEWSVAMYAFSRAIDNYAEDRGDFLPYAQMLVKRDLIDYFRSQKRALMEVPVAPHVLAGDGEPEEDTEGVYYTVAEVSKNAAVDRSLKEEIDAANELLEVYGFRFYDLTECSPQRGKTKRACAVAVRHLMERPILRAELEKTKKIPVKALAADSGVSRKIIDKYRKYIIMAVLMLEGDFPHISEYLKFIREEADV